MQEETISKGKKGASQRQRGRRKRSGGRSAMHTEKKGWSRCARRGRYMLHDRCQLLDLKPQQKRLEQEGRVPITSAGRTIKF
jgi:hypothetical protein